MKSQKPHILIAESGTGFGGTAKYLEGFLACVDREQFEIEAVSYGDGPFISKIKRSGWNVEARPDWRFGGPRGAAASLMRIPQMTAFLKQNQIQLIHLNNEIYSHIPLILAGWIAGCKLLCHLHGWRKLTRLEKIIARRIQRFVCVTHAGADFYKMQIPFAKIDGVPNGLLDQERKRLESGSREKFRTAVDADSSNKVLTLIGRIQPQKGQDVFLRAVAETLKFEKISAVLIGSTEDEKYRAVLENEIGRLDIRDHVRFIPWMTELSDVYAGSDIVIQPSVEPESFGLVMLEAMAAGCPVIASRLGGLIDVVSDGESGLLVPPRDADALAAAMLLILRDPARAGQMAKNGKKRAQLFSMEKNVFEIMKIYRLILNLGDTDPALRNSSRIDSHVSRSEEVSYAEGG